VTRLVEWSNKNGIKVTLAEAMYEVLNMNLDHVKQVTFDEEE
jgi:aryl-phospho-beta-D-glucosidase BglC (GH1 family)